MMTLGPLATTFSIVGYERAEPAWGIAIASRFLAVGAGTCWGAPGVGVVVIQAHLNKQNGADGLEMLRRGANASRVIENLMARDSHHAVRQMAVVDRAGRIATYTGERCNPWAGGLAGERCAAQGNTLAGPQVVEAMVEAFTTHPGTLARRLVDALAAGDRSGGDVRGREATALLVVHPPDEDLFDVFSHHTINLRVDDHLEPFYELSRLLDLYELVHQPTAHEERLPPSDETVRRLQQGLRTLGYFDQDPTGVLDEATKAALSRLARFHNLRQRLTTLEWIDRRVLDYVEHKAAEAGRRTRGRVDKT